MRRIKSKGNGFSITTTMLLICLVVVAFLFFTNFHSYNQNYARLQAESQDLAEQEEALNSKLASIKAEKNNTSDSRYIEDIARSQFDMVYPGEIIFKVG